MSEFHRIPKTGRITNCTAKPGNCPYGDSTVHFNSKEDAVKYWDKYEMLETFDEAIKNESSKTNFLIKFSNIQNVGWDFECYLATSYAEMNDLSNTIVYDNKTNQIWQNTNLSKTELDELKEELTKKVLEKYSPHTDKSITGDNLIRSIMFNEDKSHFVLQLGSPNATDFAIFKDEKLEIGESKKMYGEGSQLSSISVSKINEDGSIEDSRLSEYSEKIQEKLGKFNIREAVGTNYELKIKNEDSLEMFVKQYKNKGVEMLFYINSDRKFGMIDISDKTSSVVTKMNKLGFEAKTVIRANKNAKKIQQSDLTRIKRDEGGYFNNIPAGESFKLKDLILEKGKFGRYVRFGELLLPKKYKRMTFEEVSRLDPNTEIKFSECNIYAAMITGSIKQRKVK